MVNNEERWRQLCAQAAVEQDPKKLLELVKEINRLLEIKHEQRDRLEQSQPIHEGGEPPTES
jgi:hypothetical protein